MKRIVALFLTGMIALLCASCSIKEATEKTEKEPTKEHNAVITEGIEELKDYWEDLYEESDVITDGYFEIKNTRIITIKNNDIALFDDVKYIIEFELYTDYMGSAPYYENAGTHDNVIVYENGTMDVSNSLIRAYRSKTYQMDYSDFIQTIDDYHGYYNCAEKLK